MGKARVAPLKPISILRLELTAALISVDFATMLSKDLKYHDPVEVFYTDSSVVLSYIRNETKQDAFILMLEIVFRAYTTYPIHNSSITLPPQTTRPTSLQEASAPRDSLNVTFGSKALAFYGRTINVTVVNTNPVQHLDYENAEIKKVKAAVLISNGVVLKEKETRIFPVVLELKRFSH